MEIRRSQAGAVGLVLSNFPVSFLNGFDRDVCCRNVCTVV